jgi:hypothetical protein
MDDATKTTTKNLKYRNPKYIRFLNESNTIDRGALDEFLEAVPLLKEDIIICDMGASVSEQLPYYLKDNNEILVEALKELNIHLDIYCVTGGGNLFTSTMNFLSELVKSTDKKLPVTVFRNDYYWFTEVQDQEYQKFIKGLRIPAYNFTVSKDRNEITQNRIREVLEAGDGIKNAKTFSKAYFTMAIKKLPDVNEGDVAQAQA